MAGVKRLTNVATLSQKVIEERIPGDFIETGVWRGGCCILMRGILRSYGDKTRKVFVADSFEGLPAPNPAIFPDDQGLNFNEHPELAVSLDQVKANFSKYGLLDEQVEFIKGFFHDTLRNVPSEKFALLRLDGDLYESTIQALESLYPKLSPGGFVIIDDYGCIPACAKAVEDYRSQHGIEDEIVQIDWTGVYWRKSKPRNALLRYLIGYKPKARQEAVAP